MLNWNFRLQPDFNKDIHIDVPITQAGAFAFYTTYSPLPKFTTSSLPSTKQEKTSVHYVDVSPSLALRGSNLPLDALSIFSVISKFMGKYPTDWDSHLRGISERNYNMIHFTPLMKRGVSNSPYSIYDQLEFDTYSFPNGEKDVAELVTKMDKEYGLLALTDVVWNHTANNSKWLEEHPEAGYNVETAPWLEAALELDTALLKYSDELESLGLPTEFHTVDDLLKVMAGMRSHVIDAIKLWQFYVIDVKENTSRVLREWANSSAPAEPIDGVESWSLKQKADFIRQNALPGASQILGGSPEKSMRR